MTHHEKISTLRAVQLVSTELTFGIHTYDKWGNLASATDYGGYMDKRGNMMSSTARCGRAIAPVCHGIVKWQHKIFFPHLSGGLVNRGEKSSTPVFWTNNG